MFKSYIEETKISISNVSNELKLAKESGKHD